MPAPLDHALRRAGRVGPFFSVATTADAGWRPLRDLVAEPALLRAQVGTTRAALARQCGRECDDVDARAAASIHFLGLAARLVSPAFGAAVLGSVVPVLDLASVHWQVPVGGPLALAFTGREADDAASVDELARLLHDHLVDPVLEPLVLAARTEFRTSPRVLWGDVASAVGGAVVMLGQAEPTRAERAAELGAAVLRRGSLAGSVRLPRDGGAPFLLARNSCCLFYRLPGGGICGDCVLRHPVGPRRPHVA